MFGLFGPKPKFKLTKNMEVELEFESPEGFRSYFTKVLTTAGKKASFATPKVGKKYLPISKDDVVKMICVIEDTLFEVNVKVTQAMEKEFEAMISKNITRNETLLKKFDKKTPVELDAEVPLDFRAITTSHMQRGSTSKITKEFVDMVTNLPVPSGTDLKLEFRIQESPIVEAEGVSSKSEPVDEETRRSKTRIDFKDKIKESDVFDRVTTYVVHFLKRVERRKQAEEEKKNTAAGAANGKDSKDSKNGKGGKEVKGKK